MCVSSFGTSFDSNPLPWFVRIANLNNNKSSSNEILKIASMLSNHIHLFRIKQTQNTETHHFNELPLIHFSINPSDA